MLYNPNANFHPCSCHYSILKTQYHTNKSKTEYTPYLQNSENSYSRINTVNPEIFTAQLIFMYSRFLYKIANVKGCQCKWIMNIFNPCIPLPLIAVWIKHFWVSDLTSITWIAYYPGRFLKEIKHNYSQTTHYIQYLNWLYHSKYITIESCLCLSQKTGFIS